MLTSSVFPCLMAMHERGAGGDQSISVVHLRRPEQRGRTVHKKGEGKPSWLDARAFIRKDNGAF